MGERSASRATTPFIVVGLGNFGSSAALALVAMGFEVVAVDRDPDTVAAVVSRIPDIVIGDATDPDVLEKSGAREAGVGIVSMGADVTASLLAALSLRDLGVEEIHVKVVSDIHARILEKLGIGVATFPERESAERLARRVASRAILDYVDLGPDLALQEMAVPESWAGHTLRELGLPREYGISVVAVRDYLTGTVSPVPDPDRRLTDSDSLLVAGNEEHLTRVLRLID